MGHLPTLSLAWVSSWLEKVGNWRTWFPGNLVIWREIYDFETKKYIRNVGKCCNLGGKFYHVPEGTWAQGGRTCFGDI